MTGITRPNSSGNTSGFRMTHRETHDILIMVLNLYNNFIGPVSESLRTVRRMMQSICQSMTGIQMRMKFVDEMIQLLDTSIWQIEKLDQAMQRYYSMYMPPAEQMDGTEPISIAVYEANMISYNIKPAVGCFNTPKIIDGTRSWEALRQPVNYLAYMKSGEGDWLCKVVCDESKVELMGLRSGKPVDFRKGLRFKWLGRNAQVTLRSGVKSYIVIFVCQQSDEKRNTGISGQEFETCYKCLLDLNWEKTEIDKYVKFHGELPELH